MVTDHLEESCILNPPDCRVKKLVSIYPVDVNVEQDFPKTAETLGNALIVADTFTGREETTGNLTAAEIFPGTALTSKLSMSVIASVANLKAHLEDEVKHGDSRREEIDQNELESDHKHQDKDDLEMNTAKLAEIIIGLTLDTEPW